MAGAARVLISGAGPVGLTMAIELTRYGIPVRVVDKAAARTDKSKALVIWSRTLELFHRTGIAGRFLEAGQACHGARISAGHEVIARIDLGSVESPYPYGLMIPQSETERILETYLGEIGVRVEREVTLTGFAERADGISAVLEDRTGRGETVEVAWLMGCDGAHSTVRHGLGMEFEGSTQTSDWALADVHLAGLDDTTEIRVFWHADGVLVLFPIGGSRYRVIADLGPAGQDGHHADPTLAEIQAIMDRRGPGGIRAAEPIWLAAFRINERKVKDYSRGRVFLAGDAAHIHSPAGGQGMNTGMQDAFNLSWKLAMVARGICRPSLLDSYSPERSAVGDRVLRNAGRITDAAVLRNPVAQALRNHVAKFALGFPLVQHRVSDALSEVDIAYPDSPLTVTAPHAPEGRAMPKSGERWPLDGADPSPIGAGNTPLFALVGRRDIVDAIAGRFPDLVEARAPGPRTDDGLWLVRPDGYVGLTARGDDVRAVEDYLAGLSAGKPATVGARGALRAS